jgi:hypothetical protein
MRKILITIFVASIFSFIGCTKSSKAGDTSELNGLIATAALTGDPNPSKDYCMSAVVIMNQCVGTGGGFEPLVMCSSAQLSTTGHDEAAYKTLVGCVSKAVNTTYCNFPQNRVADARIALTNFFSSCDVPKGIIQSGLRP